MAAVVKFQLKSVGLKIRPFSSLRRLFFELTDGKRCEISDRRVVGLFKSALFSSFMEVLGHLVSLGKRIN